MASESRADETIPPAFIAADVPGIFLPSDFNLQAADPNLLPKHSVLHRQALQAQPTAQEKFNNAFAVFQGSFTGPGFNTIFRPNGGGKDEEPMPPEPALLELNLTHEMWNFTEEDLHEIPNRGLAKQPDINLIGRAYTQTVLDVTTAGGKRMPVNRVGKLLDSSGNPVPKEKLGIEKPRGIHFEPGLFLSVPGTVVNSVVLRPPTICRMASIPHGTTINAQGPAPETKSGGPVFDEVDITPFDIPGDETQTRNSESRFSSQTMQNPKNLPRLPQKLDATGNITQQLLNNPNALLKEHNKNKNFEKTTTLKVSTALPGNQFNPQRAALKVLQRLSPVIDKVPEAGISPREFGKMVAELEQAGNTANIAFLDGSVSTNQIASTAKVTAVFWVSTVNYKLEVKTEFKPKSQDEMLRLSPIGNFAAGTTPTFAFPKGQTIKPQIVPVQALQIQYTQTVLLNFNRQSWPHVSVATVVPLEDVQVPADKLK